MDISIEYQPILTGLCIDRFNCKTESAAHMVQLLMLIHSQKTRDRVAGRWLRECGGGGAARHGRRGRSKVRTTAVRYFG